MSTKTAKRTTIQDIASKANVSISTVSRVLNGNVPVREDKRAAVLQAVEQLEYKPNVFAQGLASGQSMAVGVLTQQISSPFYDAILHGALSGLQSTGYFPIIADGHWQPGREQRAIDTLLTRQVDGLIIIGATSPDNYLQELSKKLPIVVIGRDIPGLCTISVDNFSGGYAATHHLIQLGHRHIAHITGIVSQGDAIERRRGYEQALTDADIVVDETLIVEGQFSEQSGVLAIQMLLMRGRTFSGLFTANDQIAYGARLALFRHNIRVPDDVSIVGFDDQSASAYVIPPLTTMRQPAADMGRTSANKILQLIKGEKVENTQLSAELIIRESTTRYR